jgi:hypothetical protein
MHKTIETRCQTNNGRAALIVDLDEALQDLTDARDTLDAADANDADEAAGAIVEAMELAISGLAELLGWKVAPENLHTRQACYTSELVLCFMCGTEYPDLLPDGFTAGTCTSCGSPDRAYPGDFSRQDFLWYADDRSPVEIKSTRHNQIIARERTRQRTA